MILILQSGDLLWPLLLEIFGVESSLVGRMRAGREIVGMPARIFGER